MKDLSPPFFRYGVRVFVSNSVVEYRRVQFRFPKSKKRRICKKWRRNPRNYKTVIVNDPVLKINNDFYMSHANYYALWHQLQDFDIRFI